MVDDPAIPESSKNFQQNAFLNGVDEANDLRTDGQVDVSFASLQLPSWTNVEAATTPFDARRLHSLQFQVVTAPGVSRPYSFCVAELVWLDAASNVVPVAVPVLETEMMPQPSVEVPVDG